MNWWPGTGDAVEAVFVLGQMMAQEILGAKLPGGCARAGAPVRWTADARPSTARAASGVGLAPGAPAAQIFAAAEANLPQSAQQWIGVAVGQAEGGVVPLFCTQLFASF